PYRGAGASTQPAASPSLPSDAPLSAVGQRLLAETEGAVARQELLQIASMPAGADEPLETQLVTRWMFEMPFTTPQGAAVAQFEVGRDRRGTQEGEEPAWRVAFSLDIEPLGPIHARVSLRAAQMTVGLWAEREVGLDRLRQGQDLLAHALRQADLSAEIAIQAGSPPMRAPEAGRLVDQTS
ncbi:MAG TPA: flagellar hook-length control protein FliK, partial [Phenylobacterium sp.]